MIAAILIFFENEVALVSRVKVPHLRIGLLQLLEEVQHSFPIAGKLHLGAEIHIDVIIVGNRLVCIHLRVCAWVNPTRMHWVFVTNFLY